MIRVGVINVPRKVGPVNWSRCWKTMADRTSVFGVNETLSPAVKALYLTLAAARGYGSFGVRRSPNPIFYRKSRWRRVHGHVYKLHGPSQGQLGFKYPGFNAARYMTLTILHQRRKPDALKHVFINVHWVPNAKVDPVWAADARKTSIEKAREVVDQYVRAGYAVWLMGDTNIGGEFDLGPRFHWLRGRGIDKVGVALPPHVHVGSVDVRLTPAPTDHKHGVVAKVTLQRTKETR